MRPHVLALCDGELAGHCVTVAAPEEADDVALLVGRLRAAVRETRGFPLDVTAVVERAGAAVLSVHDRTGALTRLRERLLAPPFAPADAPAHATIRRPRTGPDDAPPGSVMVRELCLGEITDDGVHVVERFPLEPAHAQVVAGALRRDGRLLLAHRVATRRHYPDVWDLPGGHVDDGELGAAALRRELIEELAVDVGDLPPTPDAVVFLHDGDLAIWRIDEWDGEPVNVAPDEHDELRWCTRDDWSSLDLANGVPDEVLSALLAG